VSLQLALRRFFARLPGVASASKSPMHKCRVVVMMAGALPLRILLSSSRKTTSKRQYFDYAYFGCAQHKQHKQYKCRRFSTPQCSRTAFANSLASAAKELMKYRRSTVSFSPIKQTRSTIPILFKPTHFSISGRDVKFSVIQCFDCPSTALRAARLSAQVTASF